jgi:hypothetical protein
MINLLIILCYILMMALPIFSMLVIEHHSEVQWGERHHKRLLHLLQFKGKLKKKAKEKQHR